MQQNTIVSWLSRVRHLPCRRQEHSSVKHKRKRNQKRSGALHRVRRCEIRLHRSHMQQLQRSPTGSLLIQRLRLVPQLYNASQPRYRLRTSCSPPKPSSRKNRRKKTSRPVVTKATTTTNHQLASSVLRRIRRRLFCRLTTAALATIAGRSLIRGAFFPPRPRPRSRTMSHASGISCCARVRHTCPQHYLAEST